MACRSIIHSKIFSIMIIILFGFQMIGGTSQDGASHSMDLSKIDDQLMDFMNDLDPEDDVEISAQFRGQITEDDMYILEKHDIEILYQFHAIPAIYGIGTIESILALSSHHNTFWIEHNVEMELLLHETTTVINATTAWTSEVKDGSYVYYDLNDQSQLSGIDGTGVTVAIVDTGVDGQHPDLDYGEKLIMNKHKNGPDDPWVEMENTDTSYGHGTHCAGIVGGNGDASGGSRRGVAPGANLIGVGGDWTPVYWAVLEGLEWVYDHSKPGNNPNNIRVVSNSWGGDIDYDPEDSITQIANKLTYENNVVCVFAAGNAGEDNHDGATDTTSQQSDIPAVVSIAATTHDGKGLANFSSRGKKGDHITYPDVGAPGVDIWATRPRYTWLGEYQLVDQDMYYMAISGTSMATPHVAGLSAILLQAAPSLRVSDHEDDDNNEAGWGTGHDPRIHEVEYILKMTADYIVSNGSNGIPAEYEEGLNGKAFDFAQGYGLVNAKKAVAVALILEKMREDNYDATVDDALEELDKIMGTTKRKARTDTLATSWRGEWAQLTNGSNPLSTTRFSTDQHHRVFIPGDSDFLEFDLRYNPLNVNHATGGTVDLTLDWDGDGGSDIDPQPFDLDGNKHYEIDFTTDANKGAAENRGKYWTFNVIGEGIKFPITNQDDEFHEALIEYTVELKLRISPSSDVSLDETDYRTDTSPWRFSKRSDQYDDTEITIKRNVFRLSDSDEDDESFFEEQRIPIMMSVFVILLCLAGAYFFLYKGSEKEYFSPIPFEESPWMKKEADRVNDSDVEWSGVEEEKEGDEEGIGEGSSGEDGMEGVG